MRWRRLLPIQRVENHVRRGRFLGYCWTDPTRNELVVAVVPLNLILASVRWCWQVLRRPRPLFVNRHHFNAAMLALENRDRQIACLQLQVACLAAMLERQRLDQLAGDPKVMKQFHGFPVVPVESLGGQDPEVPSHDPTLN